MKLFVVAVIAACLGATVAQQQRQARRQQYNTSDQQVQRNNQQQNYNANPNDQQYNDDPQYNNQDQEFNKNTNNNQQYNNRKQAETVRQNTNDQFSSTAIPPIPIIRFQKEQTADGSYKTSYETGNNIFAEETGFLKNVGEDDKEALVQHGSYSYTSPDGTVINVSYTADEQGFRATGDHIPTPPPVPAEIQKSLDLIYEQIRIQAIQQCAGHRRKQRETRTLDARTRTTAATTSTITTMTATATATTTTTTTRGTSNNN